MPGDGASFCYVHFGHSAAKPATFNLDVGVGTFLDAVRAQSCHAAESQARERDFFYRSALQQAEEDIDAHRRAESARGHGAVREAGGVGSWW